MNEEQKSELLLRCATWLARADAFKAEAKRAATSRHRKLRATRTRPTRSFVVGRGGVDPAHRDTDARSNGEGADTRSFHA
jgi:hypothetical protein